MLISMITAVNKTLSFLDLDDNEVKSIVVKETDLQQRTEFLNKFFLFEEKEGKIIKFSNNSSWTNQLTDLDISSCKNLVKFDFYSRPSGSLTNLKLPIEEKGLAIINVENNQPSDLSIFSHLVNLQTLILRNNKFSGSLEPLRNCVKLRKLDVVDNNLDTELEYLSSSIQEFWCNKNDKFDKFLSKSLPTYNVSVKKIVRGFWNTNDTFYSTHELEL